MESKEVAFKLDIDRLWDLEKVIAANHGDKGLGSVRRDRVQYLLSTIDMTRMIGQHLFVFYDRNLPSIEQAIIYLMQNVRSMIPNKDSLTYREDNHAHFKNHYGFKGERTTPGVYINVPPVFAEAARELAFEKNKDVTVYLFIPDTGDAQYHGFYPSKGN